MFFVLPLVPAELKIIERLMNGFGILVLLSCMRAASDSRGLLAVIIGLGLLNIVFKGVEAFGTLENTGIVVVELSVALIYYLLIFMIIMRRVLDRTPVTTDKICGAVSAYILIGIVWASIYSLFRVLNPESFSIPEPLGHMVALLQFCIADDHRVWRYHAVDTGCSDLCLHGSRIRSDFFDRADRPPGCPAHRAWRCSE